MVMVAVRAVRVAVGDFLGDAGRTVEHLAVEAQALAGEFVIAVQHGLAVGDPVIRQTTSSPSCSATR